MTYKGFDIVIKREGFLFAWTATVIDHGPDITGHWHSSHAWTPLGAIYDARHAIDNYLLPGRDRHRRAGEPT